MRGRLEVVKRVAETRKVAWRTAVDNVFLDTGYEHLLKLLTGEDEVNQFVSRMQFGTGSDAALVTDTLLQTPIVPTKDIVTVEYPTVTSVRFIAYLLVDEGNGFPISEAGLLSVNGELLTRAVFATQTKTADYHFEFRWTVIC